MIEGFPADIPVVQDQPLDDVYRERSIVDDVTKFLTTNYRLRYNLVTCKIENNGEPVDDIMLNSIYVRCRKRLGKVTKELVFSVIYSDTVSRYNPFFEFFIANKNAEPTGNIDKLIATIETDTANYDMFIRKWLCAMIASIHGQHSPLMLVLCGGQNTGKTEWFRRLLPASLRQYYAESKLDSGKDDEILMTQKLIVMDDEMGGKSKQEIKKLKEMTSKQTFSIRAPYGRVSVDLVRLAMLCGTTNELQIINDPTGNRRLLPIHVKGIDHELYNSVNKDELFIEAYNLYRSGFNYQLTRDDIEVLNASTGEFEAISSEEELIMTYYALPTEETMYKVKEVTCTDIVSRLNNWSRINLNPNRMGSILKKLGFIQKTHRSGTSTRRLYRVVELYP